MRIRALPSQLGLLLLLLVAAPSPADAACATATDCGEIWVAAQDVGVPLSFFSRVLPARDAADITVGDRLVSDTNINIRRGPGDFSANLGLLPNGTHVVVEDVERTGSTGDRTQLWLRIRVNPVAVRPPGFSAMVSNEPVGRGGTSAASRQQATRVLACYNRFSAGGRTATIRDVFECSGVWVTPRALLACAIGATCPVLHDTIEDRAIRDATLRELTLTLDSRLELQPRYLPRMPGNDAIVRCRNTTNNEGDFTNCISRAFLEQHQTQVACFNRLTSGERLACFAQGANNQEFTALIGCLAGGRPTPDKVAACVTRPDVQAQVAQIRNCVGGSSGARSAIGCLAERIPQQQRQAAECLGGPTGGTDLLRCLDSVSPDVRRARLVADCLGMDAANAVIVQCVATQTGGSLQSAVACVGNPDKAAAVLCVVGDNPTTRAVNRVRQCVSSGRDASSVIANCTDGILDSRTRQTASCIAEARGNRAEIAGCAAGAVLPPEAARVVGCATSSQGPTDFALCTAAPFMNEEWRIAAECAVQSGGEPVSFAGCTAGRLTIREFTKCLEGEIGRDCFGPNNTIVVGLNNAFRDITQGPGRNNEIVRAVQAIVDATGGGPNSFVRNPSQVWGGPNSVFNNPRQILGGDNSVFNNPGQVLNPGNWRF